MVIVSVYCIIKAKLIFCLGLLVSQRDQDWVENVLKAYLQCNTITKMADDQVICTSPSFQVSRYITEATILES